MLISERGFPPAVKLVLLLMHLLSFAKDMDGRYELTRKGIVEA